VKDAAVQLLIAMLLKEQGVTEVFLVCKDLEDYLATLDQRDHPGNVESQVSLEGTDIKDQKEHEEFKAYPDILEHLVSLVFLAKLVPLDPLVLPDATEQRVNTDQLDPLVFLADLVSPETVA